MNLDNLGDARKRWCPPASELAAGGSVILTADPRRVGLFISVIDISLVDGGHYVTMWFQPDANVAKPCCYFRTGGAPVYLDIEHFGAAITGQLSFKGDNGNVYASIQQVFVTSNPEDE